MLQRGRVWLCPKSCHDGLCCALLKWSIGLSMALSSLELLGTCLNTPETLAKMGPAVPSSNGLLASLSPSFHVIPSQFFSSSHWLSPKAHQNSHRKDLALLWESCSTAQSNSSACLVKDCLRYYLSWIARFIWQNYIMGEQTSQSHKNLFSNLYLILTWETFSQWCAGRPNRIHVSGTDINRELQV